MVSREVITKPAKIPRPPSEGTGLMCIFLSSGISYNIFLSATVIITGIARNVITKDSVTDNIISSIRVVLIQLNYYVT
jgi:hypothetical protein